MADGKLQRSCKLHRSCFSWLAVAHRGEGGQESGFVGFLEEGKELVESLAGFAAGVVPFGDVEPGWAGELFGFPD